MADDDPQAQKDPSWWAVDALAEPTGPAASFDNPLEWPETSVWADLLAPEEVHGDATQLHEEAQPDSIWADGTGPREDELVVVNSALAAPTFYAETERNGRGPSSSRLGLLHGRPAVVVAVSLVSLVLLGMFLTVRARDDVPTDSSQSGGPAGQIVAQGARSTIPVTTATTTTAPPAISLSDLLPAADAAAAEAAAAGSPTGGGASAAPPTPSAPPAARGGGGGGSGAGGGGGSAPQAAQPADGDTGASEPQDPAPAPSSPPAGSTTETTRRSATTTPVPDIAIPTFPTSPSPSVTRPTVTRPSIPDFDRD